MASIGAKAALLDTSLKRIAANLAEFAELTGIEAVKPPEHDRDPELLMAYRMEAIANWTGTLVQRVKPMQMLLNTEKSADADNSEDEALADGETPDNVAEVLTDEAAADIPDATVETVPEADAEDKPARGKAKAK